MNNDPCVYRWTFFHVKYIIHLNYSNQIHPYLSQNIQNAILKVFKMKIIYSIVINLLLICSIENDIDKGN